MTSSHAGANRSHPRCQPPAANISFASSLYGQARGGHGATRSERVPPIATPQVPAGDIDGDHPLLVDSREVARLLGISRTKAFEMMARAELPVVRIGRCVRVPRDGLALWIASKTVSSDDSDPVGS